ncbi:oligosaccharide flippase family protein [Cyanobium sp. Maggiore-St4-Cus]|uniref:oligosaccharide flippase family protein n=1 Tax=Cyanobium sp. Maggiore-St4-Cus TaxID=2823717 RepID=UPI0020CDA3D9|nr:oligosaccharide flippase family protein [Cyanobium sp. Maggiore-St4-Cus]MCP9788990.1 oligosaccharide flippase family protein [Cyanobium sp. Maggiore-St4-Cus]
MNNLGLRKLIENISYTMGRQVGAAFFYLLSQILIARFYGPGGSGVIAIAMLLPTTLATFLNLGINPANVYFVAASNVSLRKAWDTTLRLGCLISFVGISIGISLLELRPQWFTGVPQLALWLGLATFPPSLFVALISGLLQSKQNFQLLNRLGFVQPIAQLLIVVLLLYFNVSNPSWLIASLLFSVLITLVFSFNALQAELQNCSQLFPSSYLWKALSYGSKAHLGNIVQFLNYKADIFIVNFFLGTAATGFYVVAVNIAESLWILSQATSSVILPRLSELSNDEAKRSLLTPLLSRWMLVLSISVALFAALLFPLLIPITFGSAFSGSVVPFLVLLPGITLLSCSRVMANDVAARGKPEFNMFLAVVVLFVNIVFNLILTPRMGLNGAALSTSISYSLDFLIRIFMVQKLTGVSPAHFILFQKQDLELIHLLLRTLKSLWAQILPFRFYR